ncbi:unnamed protein product [Rhodiola kirilowii]
MGPMKAPGLDGFSALFYQRSWRLVRAKVVTKILANRLKPILPAIISESQSAFVPGKLIFDNIIAAHELIHYLRTRGSQKICYFALKLDISKAYDRVEWDYLEMMMRKLGFPEKWIRLVMNCVVSVSYVIRVNGMVTEEITPGRGIRQGDPLSPFLFLICTEWLSMKVNEYQKRGKLNGIKICRGAPEVTHLLFADDSLFFLRANMKNAENLRRILSEYEMLSGQKVNLSKSEIYFGGNVTDDERRRICELLGVRQVSFMSRYLGLPVAFGHNRTELCKYIVEKIWKKVQGWKEKSLSIAGKEVLIKAVVQAMPTYAMSCFKIPESLIKRMVSIVSNYWWSNSKVGKGIHWCKFDKLCEEKLEGGLGFRVLSIFNDALLSKQVWRLLTCPESLVARLLKARYYKEATPISCQLGYRPSFVWRSIWTAGQQIKQCIELSLAGGRPRWSLEGNGVFSTKSAYKHLKMHCDRRRRNITGEQADNRKIKLCWRILWRLNVQPKVRMFAWRLMHNYLPSAMNLARRGMNDLKGCPVCGFLGESSIHTLLYCWWARAFWENLSIDRSFMLYEFSAPGDWLWFCVFKYDPEELSLIIQGARHIWFNRNLVLSGKESQDPLVAARYVFQNIRQLHHSHNKLVVTDLTEGRKWYRPGRGAVKMNIDGAWDSATSLAGVGICFEVEVSFASQKRTLWLELQRALKWNKEP